MECFIYKSSKKTELYLYIAKKDDFSCLPQPLYDSLGEPIFVMELELTPDRTLAREDPATVIKNLLNKGFHIQLPPSLINPPD